LRKNLGKEGRPLKIRIAILTHENLTPARSGIRGSKSFALNGGFPVGIDQCQSREGARKLMESTIEEIGNPDIYTDMFSEMVCHNPWVWQGEAKNIGEENDCLGLLCSICGRWGKVVEADHGAFGLTGKDKTLVTFWATHGQG
jgi:hypothetical protein